MSVSELEANYEAYRGIELYSERFTPDLGSKDNKTSEGPVKTPIVLLHGWGHSVQFTGALAELLSSDREVHALDLPGHGRSAVPKPLEDGRVWGMEDFALSVKSYVDSLGISEAVFIGHSFGGKTSLKLASMFPELVKELVLINSSGISPRRSFKKRCKIFCIGKLRTAVKTIDRYLNLNLFREWFIPKFASPDYLNAGPMLKIFVRTVNEDLSNALPNIDCKTLLLWGELDSETPLEMGERFNALIPNSKLIVLKGKDHVPFLGAGAHQCASAIRKFLSN